MDCFENIITLTGNCTDSVSVSGITINDIGIDLSELNSIVTADFANGEALFNRKRDFAIKLIMNLVYTHFTDYYKGNSILDSQRIGFPQDNLSLNAAEAGKLKGIRVELCNETSHIDFNLAEIGLLVDFTGNVPVYVYDLIQNKLLDTITVATTANNFSKI